MGFVANFIRFPAVQKIWTSVKIWQSYRQLQGGNFFWDTVYSKQCANHFAAHFFYLPLLKSIKPEQ